MKRTIKRNMQRNIFIEGVVRGNKGGYAFLSREGGKDLFLPHNNLGGAQHGDRVKVRIVTGDQAEVVKIVSRGIVRLSGEVYQDKSGYMLKPDLAAYYSPVSLPYAKKLHSGEKAYVEIVGYSGSRPIAKVLKVLGSVGDEQTEILSTLYGNGFSDFFPPEVSQAADALQPISLDGRKDLRYMPTITIDGDDARDFDDAISVFEDNDNYVLWVHIADVSAYVRGGSIIDREAYIRGTSVYFPKKAYPMLPEKLSNYLCSLREGEDKATVSVEMVFDRFGRRLSATPYLSCIRSDHRMTYDQVQRIFDGEPSEQFDDVIDMLTSARKLSRILSKMRAERGAINFGAYDSKILLGDDEVVGVDADRSSESTELIESFMIAANEAVAETLEKAGYPCVYRIHEPPSGDKLKQLTAFASCFVETPADGLKSGQISEFIAKCNELGEQGAIIAAVAIKCMQKAKYSPDNIGHYGLGSDCYCHFTSPIRRYPDLITHRILKRYISAQPYADMRKELNSLRNKSEDCSERERAAERAERDIVDYYKAVYMLDHLGEAFTGMISGVTANSIFVLLPNGVEGVIKVEDLPDEYYYDELRFTLVGDTERYRVGDKIEIVVVSSDVALRRVFFAVKKYYDLGISGKQSYIESVDVIRPIDVSSSYKKPNPLPRNNKNFKKPQDHKKPKGKRRR